MTIGYSNICGNGVSCCKQMLDMTAVGIKAKFSKLSHHKKSRNVRLMSQWTHLCVDGYQRKVLPIMLNQYQCISCLRNSEFCIKNVAKAENLCKKYTAYKIELHILRPRNFEWMTFWKPLVGCANTRCRLCDGMMIEIIAIRKYASICTEIFDAFLLFPEM